MTFFNKKEEVLQIELTQYGKNLLSQGKFKPVYYAFFDDDILYDSRFSGYGAGFEESINDADKRIRFDTPSLKPFYNVSGIETRINNQNEQIRNIMSSFNTPEEKDRNLVWAFTQLQNFEDRVTFNSDPLGTSKLSSDNYPAWSIRALHGEISSSSTTGSFPGKGVQQIPQINIILDYKKFVRQDLPTDADLTDAPESPDAVSDYLQASTGISPQLADQIYIAAKQDYLLLEILEHNVDFDTSNFEIEIFFSGSRNQSIDADLRSMAFNPVPKDSYITLTDQAEIADVEHYIDIFTDSEIDSQILFEAVKDDQQKNVYSDTRMVFPDRVGRMRDLYTTDGEEPCE